MPAERGIGVEICCILSLGCCARGSAVKEAHAESFYFVEMVFLACGLTYSGKTFSKGKHKLYVVEAGAFFGDLYFCFPSSIQVAEVIWMAMVNYH